MNMDYNLYKIFLDIFAILGYNVYVCCLITAICVN